MQGIIPKNLENIQNTKSPKPTAITQSESVDVAVHFFEFQQASLAFVTDQIDGH